MTEQQQFDEALTGCVAAEMALRRLLAEQKPAEQMPVSDELVARLRVLGGL